MVTYPQSLSGFMYAANILKPIPHALWVSHFSTTKTVAFGIESYHVVSEKQHSTSLRPFVKRLSLRILKDGVFVILVIKIMNEMKKMGVF